MFKLVRRLWSRFCHYEEFSIICDQLVSINEELSWLEHHIQKREKKIMTALERLTDVITEVADSTLVLRDRVTVVVDMLAELASRYEDEDLEVAISHLEDVDMMIDESAGKLLDAADALKEEEPVVEEPVEEPVVEEPVVEPVPTPEVPEVIVVPAEVPGQPDTHHPDGVVEDAFPTEGFPEDVNMETPKPHGEEPVVPEETK